MITLKDWDCYIGKSRSKETIVPLPFPFDDLQIVVTSMKKLNEM